MKPKLERAQKATKNDHKFLASRKLSELKKGDARLANCPYVCNAAYNQRKHQPPTQKPKRREWASSKRVFFLRGKGWGNNKKAWNHQLRTNEVAWPKSEELENAGNAY